MKPACLLISPNFLCVSAVAWLWPPIRARWKVWALNRAEMEMFLFYETFFDRINGQMNLETDARKIALKMQKN